MKTQTKLVALFGSVVLAGLTVVACAAPVESDAPEVEVDPTTTFNAYTVGTMQQPGGPDSGCACGGNACCKLRCTEELDACKRERGSNCWQTWTACNTRCDNSHS